MRLTIHADDFGISESVSRCIAECFAKGWVNETSLMVNMTYADKAVELARQMGFVGKVGLHLNLSQGLPLTERIKSCPRFCNEDGTFNKKFHHMTKTRFVITKAEQDAVREEVEAQLAKFVKYDGVFKKLDSHHHVHTDWSVYRLLEPLALKYGICAMRISATLHKVGLVKELYKRYLNRRIRKHFMTTAEFDGFNANLVAAAERGEDVELMVHPLYSDSGVIVDTKRPYNELMEALNG